MSQKSVYIWALEGIYIHVGIDEDIMLLSTGTNIPQPDAKK